MSRFILLPPASGSPASPVSEAIENTMRAALQAILSDYGDTLHKSDYAATRAPQPTDDETLGYSPGSRWYFGGQEFLAVATAEGAAEWLVMGTAGAIEGDVAWGSIIGVPSTFTPAVHGHAIADVTGLAAALADAASTGGTGGGVTATWDTLEGKPAAFPPAGHAHSIAGIDGLTTALAAKANTAHRHIITDIDGLEDALAGAQGGAADPKAVRSDAGTSEAVEVKGILMVTQAQYDALNAAGASVATTLYLILGPDGVAVQAMLRGDPLTDGGGGPEDPPVIDLNRIQQIAESYGGRPNVIPLRFYEGGTNEITNPTAHPMIMGFTHTVVKSGNWSDPTTWSAGTVPGMNAVVSLTAGFTTTLDVESDVLLKDLFGPLGSTLTFDKTKDTRIRADYIMLMGVTDFTDPAESNTPGKPRHEIVFHATEAPGASARLGIMMMGPTRIRGAEKKGHLRVGVTGVQAVPAVLSGADSIRVPGLADSGWRVGDTIIVLGTEYVPIAATDPQYSGPLTYFYRKKGNPLKLVSMNQFQFGQDEERQITSISGDTITLSAPLEYTHAGSTGTLHDGQVITIAPVVANVSRSIRFRSASAAEDGLIDPNADVTDLQKRAHLMFMRHPDVDARYFETKNMGRTSTDPSLQVDGLPYKVDQAGGISTVEALRASSGGDLLANPINVRGRYSIHLHWCGGPYAGARQVNLIGATAWSPVGSHPLPGWAIVQHGTRAAIEDCVVSNFRGAGMVSELGNEIGQWANNVVTGGRGDGDEPEWAGRCEHFANHNGSAGVAYENQSRAILMHGNIAGSSHYAYLWHAQKDAKWDRSPRDVDLRLADGLLKGAAGTAEFWQDEYYGAVNAQIPPFLDNEAHACMSGFEVKHRMSGTSVHGQDKTPMLMERFLCLNVPFAWVVSEYSSTYYMKDCFMQGPAATVSNACAFTMGNVSWDWNVSNTLIRRYPLAFKDTGTLMNYDGFLMDVTTEDVAEFSNTDTYTVVNNAAAHPTFNVMGDASVDPGNANRAKVRVWRNVDSATELPLPYPLAPYSRKLPANMPDSQPYPAVPIGGTPYFVLGDGSNGEISTDPVAISLTLVAGQGRGQGRIYGIIRDCVGDRRYPDWQSSESYPAQFGVRTHRSLGKLTPEQLVQRWGCYLDGATWKCRVWFAGADRFTHVKFHFSIDFTLSGFSEDFLALHMVSAPPLAPEWPDKLEAVPAPRPLTALPKALRFLSRENLEVVGGAALGHRLVLNEVAVSLSIVGGVDASHFAINSHTRLLTWAASGTRSFTSPQDANADNIYQVVLRVTDAWGNTQDQPHTIRVVDPARVSASITDDFNRADEDLEARSPYLRLSGAAGSFAIRTNRLGLISGAGCVVDMGSLGTSDMEVAAQFVGWGHGHVLFRMEDENNWLGFQRNDGVNATILSMCVAGTRTEIARWPVASASYPFIVTAEGRRLIGTHAGSLTYEARVNYPKSLPGLTPASILDLDPLAAPGTLLLPEGAPMGTKVGVYVSGTTLPAGWLDNFTAKAL